MEYKQHHILRLKDGSTAKVNWTEEESDDSPARLGISYLGDMRGSCNIILVEDVEQIIGKLETRLTPTPDFRSMSTEEIQAKVAALRKERLPKVGRASPRRTGKKKPQFTQEQVADILSQLSKREQEDGEGKQEAEEAQG